MGAFDPISGWFQKGFTVSRQAASKVNWSAKRGRLSGRSGGGVQFSKGAFDKNVRAVIRKAPEVVVKITGSSTGLATVKHHLDYISRNGQVELTDENGNSLKGAAEVKGLRDALKASQIPKESNKREFLHVMFSMPKDAPEKEVKEAVAQFCKEEFGNRRYVMAFHDDTDHKHVHVCVGTRDKDRAQAPRLSPRKNDLFRWRLGFADKLRELGVDAAASERRHRFVYRRPEHPVVRQIRADNPKSAVFNEKRAVEASEKRALREALRPDRAIVGPPRPPRVPVVMSGLKAELESWSASGIRPENPAQSKIEKSRAEALKGWQRVADNLESEGDTKLASEVKQLMKAGELEPRSRNQELFETMQSRNRGKAQENRSDKQIELD